MKVYVYPKFKPGSASPLYFAEFHGAFCLIMERSFFLVEDKVPINPKWSPATQEAYRRIMTKRKEGAPLVVMWIYRCDRTMVEFTVDAMNAYAATRNNS